MSLHPAENRGYRELYLSAREAQSRLERLTEVLPEEIGKPVVKAAAALGEMVKEFRPATARYDLHGELAAEGGGARIGTVRAAILDRFLERNQALRFAVDDLEHVTTLLAYLATLSSQRGVKQLPELCEGWERKMRRHVGAVRRAAIELGSDPDSAIEPLDPSPIGQLAHGTAVAVGTAGEAIDRTVAKRQRRAQRQTS